MLHFAGHAVWDEVKPERSWLLLAPAPGEDGHLHADELGALDLSRVRLIVLSSCRTIGSGLGRTGGFAGFARPLLTAGVNGVVGSLWQVDDEATGVLMQAFHAEYRSTGDAAEALRRAQIEMMRSPDPRLRPASAWSGFLYAGS
jgi:CHAT domain-containing protein